MYLGMDLGGMSIKVGLVDDNFNIVKTKSMPTGATRTDREIVKDMALLCKEIMTENGLTEKDFKFIGVGCPGTPDVDNGVLVYANNLPFVDTPIRKYMNEIIDLPIYLDNDGNCAALGEAYAGTAKGVRHAVVITLGTGVGGGIIIDRKIYSGFNYSGGELGHTLLILDGERCTCGRNGCIEAYASATGLIRQTKRAAEKHPESVINKLINGDINNVTGKTAFDAMRQGDAVGIEVVENFTKYLAAFITDLINIFAPEIILIGGGISKEGDTLLNPIRKYVKAVSYNGMKSQTRIERAQLGNDAGIIGASVLGLQ